MTQQRYYDRQGRPLASIADADWSDAARRVARTALPDGTEVSTVHLVIDHQWGDGPPLIFESMIFGGPLDQECARYATEAQAREGHAEMVARAREAVPA